MLEVSGLERGIKLPSGLLVRYDDLSAEQGEKGIEYSYKNVEGVLEYMAVR